MKKLLLIATGGTIASKYTEKGLAPRISSEELLTYVPEAAAFCEVDTVQPFNLDSTNISSREWLMLAELIEKKYEYYDGYVICHGTDTMAYTAAALSYLIQNNLKPIVITGSQRPIDLAITDARANLLDSLRFAAHPKAHGVNIVFGGTVIAGTRAKKERSKSYHAFSSINYPDIAVIQDNRIAFYIDDKYSVTDRIRFYHELNDRVFVLKLIPGSAGAVIDAISGNADALIIESFGVGGLPDYGDNDFYHAVSRFIEKGKTVIMATQVTREGSDMSVYQVGKMIKNEFSLLESYDMTLEAVVAKTMWALKYSRDRGEFRENFYKKINRDIIFSPDQGNEE